MNKKSSVQADSEDSKGCNARKCEKKVVQISVSDKIKVIISTEAPAAQKEKEKEKEKGGQQVHKDSNASTTNNEAQTTEETGIDTKTLGARESKAKAWHDILISYPPTLGHQQGRRP